MKPRVARSIGVPTSEHMTAIGRATNRVTRATPSPAHPVEVRPCQVSSDPNTAKIPSLTISTRSSDWLANASRMSGRRIPSTIAATNTAISPLPLGSRTAAP